jgi:hypothetical protein
MASRPSYLPRERLVAPKAQPSAVFVGVERSSATLAVTMSLCRDDRLPILQILAFETDPAIILEGTRAIVLFGIIGIIPLSFLH